MLNEIDKKLIKALQQDGRATHKSLSQKLGIHESTISRKLQYFEKKGIMNIRALPNPYKLGYRAHAVMALRVAPSRVEDICTQLSRIFNVNLVVTTIGRFDIMVIAFFSSWEDLFSFIDGYRSETDGILEMQVYFVNKIIKRNYGFPDDNGLEVKIDDVDHRIIEKLAENGRFTANYLATEVGVSLPTCMRRLSLLLNEKVIAVKALPNPEMIGIKSSALILLRTRPEKVADICRTLHLHREIFLIMTFHSGYDIIVGLNASSPSDLNRFLKKHMMPLDGIISVDTQLYAELKKRYYGGFLPDDPLHDKYDLNFEG